jgi:hypothetical protein
MSLNAIRQSRCKLALPYGVVVLRKEANTPESGNGLLIGTVKYPENNRKDEQSEKRCGY